MSGQFRILEFKAYAKNSLQGFLDVQTDTGMIVRGCSLHVKNGSKWIGLPQKSYTKNDNSTVWLPVVEFSTKEALNVFRDRTLDALDRFHGNGNRGNSHLFDGDQF
jgi:hypothetical protein